MIDWFLKINPIYPLFIFTVASFIAYITNVDILLIGALVVVTVLQLCYLLWNKSNKYTRLADDEIESQLDEDSDGVSWEFFYENIHVQGVREKLRYRIIGQFTFVLLMLVLTSCLTLIEVYIGTIIGGLLIVCSIPRLIKSSSIYLKNQVNTGI